MQVRDGIQKTFIAKKFGRRQGSRRMAEDLESDDKVSERCKTLRRAMGYEQSSAFAAFLDVSPQRWNNVEIGMPLGRDLAMTVARKVPGMSLDWLYRGRTEALPLDLARRLGELPQSVGKATTRPRRGS